MRREFAHPLDLASLRSVPRRRGNRSPGALKRHAEIASLIGGPLMGRQPMSRRRWGGLSGSIVKPSWWIAT